MLLKNKFWMYPIIMVFLETQPTFAAYLRILGNSTEQFTEEQLDNASNILVSPYYNSCLPNIMYTSGFNGKTNGPFTELVLNAFIKLRYRLNLFLVNWEKEAAAVTTMGNVGYAASYSTSGAPNSIKVGKALGLALESMSNNGFNLSNTHAIGHSLGAHLLGNAGRYLKGILKNLSRITGCDPAGALYDQYFHLLHPLDKSCADFVDSIHTDPGGYAMNTSVSHLDIYFNFGNFISGLKENQVQNGCPIGDFDMFTTEDLCSHNRCLLLLIQAWSGKTLLASQAPDYRTWQANQEQGVITNVVQLGENTNRTAFGNYYANTKDSPPYQTTD